MPYAIAAQPNAHVHFRLNATVFQHMFVANWRGLVFEGFRQARVPPPAWDEGWRWWESPSRCPGSALRRAFNTCTRNLSAWGTRATGSRVVDRAVVPDSLLAQATANHFLRAPIEDATGHRPRCRACPCCMQQHPHPQQQPRHAPGTKAHKGTPHAGPPTMHGGQGGSLSFDALHQRRKASASDNSSCRHISSAAAAIPLELWIPVQ